MILKLIFKNLGDSRWGEVMGIYECGNEPSGSVKCGEFFD